MGDREADRAIVIDPSEIGQIAFQEYDPKYELTSYLPGDKEGDAGIPFKTSFKYHEMIKDGIAFHHKASDIVIVSPSDDYCGFTCLAAIAGVDPLHPDSYYEAKVLA